MSKRRSKAKSEVKAGSSPVRLTKFTRKYEKSIDRFELGYDIMHLKFRSDLRLFCRLGYDPVWINDTEVISFDEDLMGKELTQLSQNCISDNGLSLKVIIEDWNFLAGFGCADLGKYIYSSTIKRA